MVHTSSPSWANDPSLLHCQLHRSRDQAEFGAWNALGSGLLRGRCGAGGQAAWRRRIARRRRARKGARSTALLAIARGAGFDSTRMPPIPLASAPGSSRWTGRWTASPIAGKSSWRDFPTSSAGRSAPGPIVSTSSRSSSASSKERGRLHEPNAHPGRRPLSRRRRCAPSWIGARARQAQAVIAALVGDQRQPSSWRPGGAGPLLCPPGGRRGCDSCGLQGAHDARAPAHRKARAVALATEPSAGSRFIEVPESSTVAVGRGLEIAIASI